MCLYSQWSGVTDSMLKRRLDLAHQEERDGQGFFCCKNSFKSENKYFSPEPIYSNSNAMFFVEEKGSKFQVKRKKNEKKKHNSSYKSTKRSLQVNKMVSSGAVVAQYFETEGVSHFIHVNSSDTFYRLREADLSKKCSFF